MIIYCCGCGDKIEAELVSGKEVYPHRPDLYGLPFWQCSTCHNFVGCHHKTKDRTKPLGCIPTPEIRKARGHIHRILDPMWKGKGSAKRKEVYQELGQRIGRKNYHTAYIRSIEEARMVYAELLKMKRAMGA